MTRNYDAQIEQAHKETQAVIKAADKLLKAAGPISDDDVPRAIMALLVAAASLGRTEEMDRAQFTEAAKLSWDQIHSV